MAKGNFAPSLADVLVHEGDYTADRRDPGNCTGGKVGVGETKGTKKGIAAASYPHLDIKNLTDAKIAEIYEPIIGARSGVTSCRPASTSLRWTMASTPGCLAPPRNCSVSSA